MQSVDLNLLEVLDALLQEGSVTGAARRLHLSPPAVSRSLSRLRTATADPLLVRVGRNLTPTAVAVGMRESAHDTLAAARDLLTPHAQPSDADLERDLDAVFTVRTGYDAAEAFGPRLVESIQRRAPGVRLRLLGDVDPIEALRNGSIDLDIGAPVDTGTEPVHRQRLVTDTLVIVGRKNGRLAERCGDANPTPEDLAAVPHVTMSRLGVLRHPLDEYLATSGLTRHVVATAPGFPAVILIADRADLVCLAPHGLSKSLRGAKLRSWPVPYDLPTLAIEQLWHQRTHTDPAHRWLRARVCETVRQTPDTAPASGHEPPGIIEPGKVAAARQHDQIGVRK